MSGDVGSGVDGTEAGIGTLSSSDVESTGTAAYRCTTGHPYPSAYQ
ncbi:hypothetical protein [Streptomyces sp. NPDC005262]